MVSLLNTAKNSNGNHINIVQSYMNRGWSLVPIPKGEKGPRVKSWQQGGFTEEDFKPGMNIGLLLGEASNKIVDVDLDCKEAILAAPYFLPDTGMVQGRDSAPSSHWFYMVEDAPKRLYFTYEGRTLVEIRGNGHQTVIAPSVHPSGEVIAWKNGTCQPSTVMYSQLEGRVRMVAAVALIASVWIEGDRHSKALAIAGFLCRNGIDNSVTRAILQVVCDITNDNEWKDRETAINDTLKKVADKKQATGGPTLAKMVSPDFVAKLSEILDIKSSTEDLTGKNLEEANKEYELDILNRLALEPIVHQTPGGLLFATVEMNGKVKTLTISERGSGFSKWLIHRYMEERDGKTPRQANVSQTMQGVIARATFDSDTKELHTRYAEHNGRLYLDLANDEGQVVEIDRTGWRIINNPPILFKRPNGMLPLPMPQSGGSLEALKEIMHFSSDTDYRMVVAWLLGAMHPTGPYPILILSGEQGTAKSTTSRFLRMLIDPNKAPLRPLPEDDRAVAIAALNNYCLVYDNVSHIPTKVSDALCRVATEAGFATRTLFSDDSETVFNDKRPQIINGIDDSIVNRGDLLNRSIVVQLSPISEENRKTEEEVKATFNKCQPMILGALLDAIVGGLNAYKGVKLNKLPRMADMAKWVVACEGVLGWKKGLFYSEYSENQENALAIEFETNVVAQQIAKHFTDTPYHGHIGELYDYFCKEDESFSKVYKSPRGLSGALSRVLPALRSQGYKVDMSKDKTKRGKPVHIEYVGDRTEQEEVLLPLQLQAPASSDLPTVHGLVETAPATFDHKHNTTTVRGREDLQEEKAIRETVWNYGASRSFPHVKVFSSEIGEGQASWVEAYQYMELHLMKTLYNFIVKGHNIKA